ncbi:hypothetical protein Psch_03828 [Pelotomaculum schinkii]|uniref:Uncharacterized protein n=1 Tax=Pelotomaculum schinkii TaxID=78350 RepID=A0A4Y7R7W2_9FIRM|nr:hypothetical protein Psch_03828 [Pelotomaculum schinkii]
MILEDNPKTTTPKAFREPVMTFTIAIDIYKRREFYAG